MPPISGDTLRGHLEPLILSTLSSTPAHGFEILKRLHAAAPGSLHLKEGSLYPALYRLEKAGLVSAQWEPDSSPRRGPRRRTYRLTPKGRRRLQSARSEFAHFASIITTILGAPA